MQKTIRTMKLISILKAKNLRMMPWSVKRHQQMQRKAPMLLITLRRAKRRNTRKSRWRPYSTNEIEFHPSLMLSQEPRKLQTSLRQKNVLRLAAVIQ